jgi:hypothetical protein
MEMVVVFLAGLTDFWWHVVVVVVVIMAMKSPPLCSLV